MSALQKLKAYFGMVPADEMDYEGSDDYAPDYQVSSNESAEFDSYDDRSSRRHRFGTTRLESVADPSEPDFTERNRTHRSWTPPSPSRNITPVRGALAMEMEQQPAMRPAPQPQPQSLSKITTVHPRSYMEARTIGEHYRDGIPVIMNLTDMDNADAKRLVDFAAGLAFAVHGSMEKVTDKVFLISPPNVDVTAADRQRLAEGGVLH